MDAESKDELRFQRMACDVRYFCSHPEAAQPYYRGWIAFADRMSVLASSTGATNEDKQVAREHEQMGSPDNKAMAALNLDQQEWILMTGTRYNLNVHRCCCCFSTQDGGTIHYRLKGRKIYLCADCLTDRCSVPEMVLALVRKALIGDDIQTCFV